MKNNGYILYIYIDLLTSISLVCTRNFSTKLTKRITKLDKSKKTIEKPLSDIIIGLLLGEGHIQKRTFKGNSRFIYGQSSLRKHHLNYFNHILELFVPFLSEEFKLKEKSFLNKKTNIRYRSVNFTTLSFPCFNYYKNLFFNSDNIKIVPSNIQNLLSPIGLAYWIMVDGSIQNKGLHLNTYGFTHEDILILKRSLEDMFGFKTLKCSIHKHNKGERKNLCMGGKHGIVKI